MRKFDEREREIIAAKLISEGRRQFEALGLKKTSVADLTKAAGIAQGSFYLFYGSKEELYYDILLQEEHDIREQMLAPLREGRVSREAFKQLLQASIRLMEERPLLRQLYDEAVMEQLFRKLPEEKLSENFQNDADDLLPVLLRGKEQGWLTAEDPETVVSLLRAVVLLSFQKRQIGEEQYDATMELLTDLIARGLVAEGEGETDDDRS
ncbi:TetR/AcrR family transcriptional regulator [Paenibacillus sambharensis]|uniref:TetR/AcrR family transcriptional regulator n=1 Tax=Paenibacillus sambharensis TaxID=1803190 RepID=A0A2W1LKD0_9BACL|nr:TetR/AcrR family transcriptional regulator [Paenibacillus sambharensis]PZD95462.1 TetR/AcrR family transcriptional regulator [Paenibacillus sambharensis]